MNGRRQLVVPWMALFLSACTAVPPPPRDEAPRVAAPPTHWKSSPAAELWTIVEPSDQADRGNWWKAYGDTELNRLIAEAERNNADLAQAAARVQRARAAAAGVDASRRPQIGTNTQARRARESGQVETWLGVGVSAAYEFDLFDRARLASEAEQMDASAQALLMQGLRLIVQVDVARGLLALRTADAELRLLRETLAIYDDTLLLVARRVRSGDLAELDMARLQAEVATTQTEVHALEQRRGELENTLAELVGEPASSFRLPRTAQHRWAHPTIPAGLPGTLLARRPDVAAALSAWKAQLARLDVAQRAWFPRLVLTADAGLASFELADLARGSARAWSLGALLSMPLFDGGRRAASLAAARADLEAAAVDYRAQLLTAFREVEDQLTAYQSLQEQERVAQVAVDAATRATRLSSVRWKHGLVSQLEFLDAQRSELRARRNLLRTAAARDAATVGLVRALGGGWQAES